MDNHDFENLLDNYWAKSPDTNGVAETISEHTACVLKEADRLVQLGYISDDLYNLLHYACEKHDYGKVNEHMQTRLHNKSIHFDPDSEVQHNLLSALFIDDHDFAGLDIAHERCAHAVQRAGFGGEYDAPTVQFAHAERAEAMGVADGDQFGRGHDHQ